MPVLDWILLAVLACSLLLGAWRGLLLPATAALYLLWTLDSARAEWAGRGGFWKGEALRRG